MTAEVLFSETFPATAEAVRGQLTCLQARVGGRDVDADAGSDMLIVLGEVLNNIVEHATAGRDDGRISVTVRDDGARLSVETADDGRPLPPTLLTCGAGPLVDGSTDDLPEGGFGWFMIHSLARDMMYERREGLNLLSFSLAAG